MSDRTGTLSEALAWIAARYGIADLYAFGSRGSEIAARVRGKAVNGTHTRSDVDMAVQPLKGGRLSARERVQLAAELEDVFGAGPVDLVILDEASPYLALDVIRGELLFAADPHGQAEHELYIMRKAADLAPHERERRRLIAERLRPS